MQELLNTVIILLIANAIVHLLSFKALNTNKETNRWTVFAFAIINIILVILLKIGFWPARYLAVLFPLIGGISLVTQLDKSKSPKWMDYTILVLDALTIVLLIYAMIFISGANEPRQ